MKRLSSRYEVALLALIVMVAMFFRTFRLDAIPRGMTADEATFGLEAWAIARGDSYPVFLRGMSGALPMFAYLTACLFRLVGTTIQTARSTAALVGIGTVPLFYLLMRQLFPKTAHRPSRAMIPLVSTLLLAVSYWHVVYSRLGIEPVLVPLFGTLALYSLVRARNSGRRAFFILTGLFLGLALYAYPAAYVLPVVVLTSLGYYAWLDRQFLRAHWVNVLLLFVICFAVAAPLGLFAVTRLDLFTLRASEVALLGAEHAARSPLTAFVVSSAKTAAMFVWQGDSSLVRNPASRPVLDPLTTVLFILGLAVAVCRWKQPSHFLPLAWLLVMCLPAAVTTGDLPHFSRPIGALPSTCIIAAIGLSFAWEWFDSRVASQPFFKFVGPIVVAVAVLFATAATYRDYFVVWDTRVELAQGYDGAYSAAARIMNETQVEDSVWILPLAAPVPSGYGGDHFDFLYRGETPYYTVSLDEATAPGELSSICVGRRTALVVDWKGYVPEEAHKAMAADAKGLIPFLFAKYGRELGRTSYEAFDVVAYQLPESPAFFIADHFEPLAVNFGDELMLTGVAFGGSSLRETSTTADVERRELPSGKSGWVALRWQALGAPTRDYKVAVYLQDEPGHVAGQADKLLLSNYLHTTRDWKPGQAEMDYYRLPSWGGTAPGWYTIGVTVYDAETLLPVTITGGGATYALGAIEIVRPLAAGEVKPEARLDPAVGDTVPGLRMLGYDLPAREMNPGDTLSVALYWQSLEEVNRNYLLAVQLSNQQGRVWADKFDAPVHGTYPTATWAEGEVLKDWHDLSLPADLPQGTYQVSVLISENDALLREVTIGQIDVRGRAHQFTVPEIEHPLKATLGDAVRLLGYGLNKDEVKTGDTVQLTLYWQALKDMRTSYTVFTHLLDGEDRVRGQSDSVPGAGTLPTTSWVEGEFIVDEDEIRVEEGAPAGRYVIEVGMYNAQTGERLPTYDGQGNPTGDRILLTEIEVTAME